MAGSTQLDAWLKDFPRDEVERRVRELENELVRLRHALSLNDSFRAANGSAPTKAANGNAPPNRPAAIRQVLRDGRGPMSPGDIKEQMIERGWLGDDARELKKFYSALSTMARRSHLLRLQDGRYVLPPNLLEGPEVS